MERFVYEAKPKNRNKISPEAKRIKRSIIINVLKRPGSNPPKAVRREIQRIIRNVGKPS